MHILSYPSKWLGLAWWVVLLASGSQLFASQDALRYIPLASDHPQLNPRAKDLFFELTKEGGSRLVIYQKTYNARFFAQLKKKTHRLTDFLNNFDLVVSFYAGDTCFEKASLMDTHFSGLRLGNNGTLSIDEVFPLRFLEAEHHKIKSFGFKIIPKSRLPFDHTFLVNSIRKNPVIIYIILLLSVVTFFFRHFFFLKKFKKSKTFFKR